MIDLGEGADSQSVRLFTAGWRNLPMFELERPREVPLRDAILFWAGAVIFGVALGLLAVALGV